MILILSIDLEEVIIFHGISQHRRIDQSSSWSNQPRLLRKTQGLPEETFV